MSEIAENNQWYKGRQPIVEEFSDQHRALLSALAGRNFCKPPGFLMEASLALEEAGKNKLSALNYQIVAEAIERELKQTGHDYTQAYKAARIVFELEKQTLLTALQQEFSDLDAAQSLTEEELNSLFVELDIRRIILITTKTAIELEAEGLKQELIGIDRLTFANEELLINEKVVTANAKLAVIPYLEALIEAQERILTAEEANLPLTENLIDEKELLIAKKEELLPYIEEKADARIELADKKEEMLPYIEEKANTQTELASKKEEILTYIEDKIDAQVELSDKKEELLSYVENKIDAQIALVTKKEELLPYMEDKADVLKQLALKTEEIFPDLIDKTAKITEVGNKELELIPYIIEKASEQVLLAIALEEQISFQEQMVTAAIDKMLLKTDIVDNEVAILKAQSLVEDMRKLLIEQRQNLQEAVIDKKKEFVDTDNTNLEVIKTQRNLTLVQLQKDKIDLRINREDSEGTILDEDILKDETIHSSRILEEQTLIDTERLARVADIRDSATAAAAADITSKLIHLIGS